MTASRPTLPTLLLASVALLLVFWGTRLLGLGAFPPFLDEMQHVDLTEKLIQTGPLAYAEEGRLLTYWWLAPFQPHMQATVWVARMACLLLMLPGFAGILGLGWMSAGRWGLILAAALGLFSTYHFFFQRMALADPLSASAVIVAAALAYRLQHRPRLIDAALVGLSLFVAVGFKVTSLPYLGIPIAAALALRPHNRPWSAQMRWGAVALGVGGGLTVAFVVGLLAFGHNPFTLALLYNQSPGSDLLTRVGNGLGLLMDVLTAYFSVPGAILLGISLLMLLARRQWYLPLCLLAPLVILLLNQRQGSRYLIPAVTLLVACAPAALALIPSAYRTRLSATLVTLVIAAGGINWAAFASTNQTDPAMLPLRPADQQEYVRSDASGFGLTALIAELEAQDVQRVIGVMANCWGLRYLALDRFPVDCPRLNPNGSDVEVLTALMESSRAARTFVALEELPYVPTTAPGRVIAVIQRPAGSPTLTLYALAPDG